MIAERLTDVRRHMQRAEVDALLVRSTDRFLNEYVPNDESSRVWISGFTGSMGEVVITAERAFLIVDGRYWIQADKEIDPDLFEVVRVAHGTGIDAEVVNVLRAAAEETKVFRVGYEPERLSPRTLEHMRSVLEDVATFKPVHPSPVDEAREGQMPPPTQPNIRLIDEHRVGLTVGNKLDRIAEWLHEHKLDGLLVQRLDDIAYLSNLRGDELPYQATFKSMAMATAEKLYIGIDVDQVPQDVQHARPHVEFLPEDELWALFQKKKKRRRIAYDVDHNTELGRMNIEGAGALAVPLTSPIGLMKAYKTDAELVSMKDAFRRADQVVHAAIRWACTEVAAGRRVTEASFARRVEATFRAHGAVGLSFRVISAAGKNGAIIHYSDPSPRRALKEGELMLLDTGAYFAEGYATDLTRTFLVGGPRTKASEQQRRYYTLVLKAAMAGMRAVFPEGTQGTQIDALVRAPLWEAGLNYAHGTGHGVGINVHEFPPRIAPRANTPLMPGLVFSIEPGVYLPSFGGVRIENLCTVEPVPKLKGFNRIVPLTFSPFDKRLINTKMLSPDEKAWLRDYERQFTPAKITVDDDSTGGKSKAAGRAKGARTRRKAARRPR
ncbi:MAG: M24 family metallopeptidase [Myxococcota bacterium]